MSSKIKYALVLGLVLIGAGGLAFTMTGGNPPVNASVDPSVDSIATDASLDSLGVADGVYIPDVQTLQVSKQRTYAATQSYAGRVVARQDSSVGFQRGGLLTDIMVDEGERVTAGAVLAQLDVRSLQAQRQESLALLQSARSQVNEIEARLDLARKTSERQRTLNARGHASAQTLDEAESQEQALVAQLAVTRAQVTQANTALNTIDVELELSQLVAPFGGIVTHRYFDAGAAINAGQPVLQIIEDKVLEVRVSVTPAIAQSLNPNTTYDFTVQGQSVPVILNRVIAEVDAATRTMIAIFQVPSDLSTLVPGNIGSLTVERTMNGEEGFWVPISALAEGTRGLWTVYAVVPTADQAGWVVEQRPVVVLHAETERVFVRGVVEADENIVAAGLSRLVAGMQVNMPAN